MTAGSESAGAAKLARPTSKSIWWVLLFGLWPRFLCLGLFSAVCFAVSTGETQVWLGDLRVVVLVWLCFSFCCFIDLLIPRTFLSLYRVLPAYSQVRTELSVRHRPYSREKNSPDPPPQVSVPLQLPKSLKDKASGATVMAAQPAMREKESQDAEAATALQRQKPRSRNTGMESAKDFQRSENNPKTETKRKKKIDDL